MNHPSFPARRRLAFIALLTVGLAACTADDTGPSDQAPSFIVGCSKVTATRFQSNPLTPTHNSSGNEAVWFLHNNSGSNLAVTSIGCTRSGGVSSCTPENNETTLLTGNTDFEVSYNVGTSNGTVDLTVHLSCGSVSIPAYSVDPT